MEDGGVILWYPYGAPNGDAVHIEKLEAVGRGFECSLHRVKTSGRLTP